jgi:hypothetical protein
MKVDAKRAEQVPLTHKLAKESLVWIFSQRMHPIHSIRPKTHALGHFGPFCYCMKVVAKLAEQVPIMHKFAKRSCFEIFRNECTRSTKLDPKLMFWGTLDCFVTAWKLWQNWPNRCHWHTRSLNKVASEFFATNAPDLLHWTQNSCFGVFRTILLWHENWCKTDRTGTINA